MNGVTVAGCAPMQQMFVPGNCYNAVSNQTPVLPVMLVQPVAGLSALPVTPVPVHFSATQPVMAMQQGAMSANTSQISVQDFRSEVGKILQLFKICYQVVLSESCCELMINR